MIVDIWHRLGRVIRYSNIGTLLFFVLNVLAIMGVFYNSGYLMEIIILYIVTVAISLTPMGELLLAYLAGASEIKRTDVKIRIVPLVQLVLDRAKENTAYSVESVKVMIVYDDSPNAFAMGRRTICITKGLLNLPDDAILGVLAHEVGHLAYGHTVVQLFIGGGNIFISGFLLLFKLAIWIITGIMGLFALGTRDGWIVFFTGLFAAISAGLSWLWVKFCRLFLMWSMRQNEFVADEYAQKIGFGMELAKVLDQHLCDVPHKGFFKALYNTHPYNDDRIVALQNLGVPYSRY